MENSNSNKIRGLVLPAAILGVSFVFGMRFAPDSVSGGKKESNPDLNRYDIRPIESGGAYVIDKQSGVVWAIAVDKVRGKFEAGKN